MAVKKAKVPVQKGKIKPKQVTSKMMSAKAEDKADGKAAKMKLSGQLFKKK